MFEFPSVGQQAEFLNKNSDQAGRSFEEGLMLIGTQWPQRFQPLGRCPVFVELFFLELCRRSNTALDPGVAHDREMPGLHIGAAGRAERRLQAMLDHSWRQWPVGKITNGAPALQIIGKLLCPCQHLLRRILSVGAERQETGIFHSGLR